MCTKWCPRCHIQAIVLSGGLRVITNPQRYSQRTVCPTEFQLTQASGAIPVLKALVEKYQKFQIYPLSCRCAPNGAQGVILKRSY